jgi:hypothetical protein
MNQTKSVKVVLWELNEVRGEARNGLSLLFETLSVPDWMSGHLSLTHVPCTLFQYLTKRTCKSTHRSRHMKILERRPGFNTTHLTTHYSYKTTPPPFFIHLSLKNCPSHKTTPANPIFFSMHFNAQTPRFPYLPSNLKCCANISAPRYTPLHSRRQHSLLGREELWVLMSQDFRDI